MELIENQLLGTSLAFIYGLLFGSFATMASHRIPLKEELIFTPSHCPKCNHKLGIIDLFPVFSWLFNHGKCHYCKTPVHWRYPAIELATGALFAAFYWQSGFTLLTLSLTLMTVCLVICWVMLLESGKSSSLMATCLLLVGTLYKYAINVDIIDVIGTATPSIMILTAFLCLKKLNPEKIDTNTIKSIYMLVAIVFLVPLDNIIKYAAISLILFFITALAFKGRKLNTVIQLSLINALIIEKLLLQP